MLNDLARKYFGLFTVAGAVLGLLLPSLGLLLQPFILAALFVLMFYATAKIDKGRLMGSLKKPGLVLLGLALIYIAVPLVLYSLAILGKLPDETIFGVVFAALAPTIVSAPFFVSMIKGDVEYSYILSVISTLLAPVAIPSLLFLLMGKAVAMPLSSIASTMAALIILPAVCVLLVRKLLPDLMTRLEENESAVTGIDFTVFIWAIIAANASVILSFSPLIAVLIVLAVVQEFGFYFLTRFVSKRFLPEGISKALALCVGVKNTVLTAGIALLFSSSVALPSGIVVLAAVPMFVLIGWLKEKM